MQRIYLAARFSRHPEMREIANVLVGKGCEVTSRWIDGSHGSSFEDALLEDRIKYALEDLEDIGRADTVISFTEEPRKPHNNRGGRHVEYGYALALQKHLVVIGYQENVFHLLREVIYYPSFEAFIKTI